MKMFRRLEIKSVKKIEGARYVQPWEKTTKVKYGNIFQICKRMSYTRLRKSDSDVAYIFPVFHPLMLSHKFKEFLNQKGFSSAGEQKDNKGSNVYNSKG